MFVVCQWIKDFLGVFAFVLLSQMSKALGDRIVMSFIFSCFCFLDAMFFCYAQCYHLKWTLATYKGVFCAIVMCFLTILCVFTSMWLPLSGLCWVMMFINLGCIYSVVSPNNAYT
jgi:hypothetical protein